MMEGVPGSKPFLKYVQAVSGQVTSFSYAETCFRLHTTDKADTRFKDGSSRCRSTALYQLTINCRVAREHLHEESGTVEAGLVVAFEFK